MKVTVERIPESQVLLNIEVEPERVERSLDQAYRRLLPRARVPGFRPGKAPRAVLERHYGRAVLLEEALEKLAPDVVREAIAEQSIEAYGSPQLEIASLEPVVVKATVPVKPTIDLGDYRALRIEAPAIAEDPTEIDQVIENLRLRNALIEPVERPVQDGDTIRLDLGQRREGEEFATDEDIELTVTHEALDENYPGLYEQLIGMSAGEERTVTAPEPTDEAGELAGAPIDYVINLKDVKETRLPDLDDEFAQSIGESFPTMAALRERLESDLRGRRQTEAEREFDQQAIDRLLEGATLEFPPQLIEREVERSLHDQFINNDDHKGFERMLQQAGISEEALRVRLRPAAAERVRQGLALNRLRELEGISVTPEDVQHEIEEMAGGVPDADRFRQIFDTDAGRETISQTLLNRRTVERLRAIVRGEEPPLPEPSPAGSDGATGEPTIENRSVVDQVDEGPGPVPVSASAASDARTDAGQTQAPSQPTAPGAEGAVDQIAEGGDEPSTSDAEAEAVPEGASDPEAETAATTAPATL